MPTAIDCALLAGSAYFDTRAAVNRFPVPSDWTLISLIPEQASGFEARTFQKGPEIVISYAGTYDKSATDIAADVALYGGRFHAQLLQAARYYLDIRAANPGKLGSDSN